MGEVIINGDDADDIYDALVEESGLKERVLTTSPGGDSEVVITGFSGDEVDQVKDALCDYGPLRDDAVRVE